MIKVNLQFCYNGPLYKIITFFDLTLSCFLPFFSDFDVNDEQQHLNVAQDLGVSVSSHDSELNNSFSQDESEGVS